MGVIPQYVKTNLLCDEPIQRNWVDLIGSPNKVAVVLDEFSNAFCWPTSGDNTASLKVAPASIAGGRKWIDFAFNQSQCIIALDQSSYAWSWGSNTNGMLGNNQGSGTYYSPVSVVGARKFIDICCVANNTYALDMSSYMWAWGGTNANGWMGDGTAVNRSSPVSVIGGIQWGKFNKKYSNSVCVFLDISSYAWAWGLSGVGTLGDNTTTSKSSPVSVVGGIRFNYVEGDAYNCYGIDESSKLWSWGANSSGQLGDGTVLNRSSPVSVLNQTGLTFLRVVGTKRGPTTGSTVMAVDSSSRIWAWGVSPSGNGPNYSTMVLVPHSNKIIPNSLQLVSVNVNSPTVGSAIDELGYILSWGPNNSFFGDGNSAVVTFSYNPYVSGLKASKRVIFDNSVNSVALKDSALWVWGPSCYDGRNYFTYTTGQKSIASMMNDRPINIFGR